jgi:nuclear pore complex protein Nup93
VQRNIQQVEQYSQRLRGRAARADASTEALEASRLLAQEGLNPRKLSQALQTFELRPSYEDVFAVETANVDDYLQQVGDNGGWRAVGRWLVGWS